ncbi:MAG: hypothetical protein HYV27_04830 [Candidatus Hydrogenedentes bacterium]|nr:hypothetical protein [Candidatus Hydrogenedentota bacterium]
MPESPWSRNEIIWSNVTFVAVIVYLLVDMFFGLSNYEWLFQFLLIASFAPCVIYATGVLVRIGGLGLYWLFALVQHELFDSLISRLGIGIGILLSLYTIWTAIQSIRKWRRRHSEDAQPPIGPDNQRVAGPNE